MDTYYASPQRSSDEELKKEIEFVSKNSIIEGLLQSVSGLLGILNEHRQIIALNESLLKAIGVNNASEVLGLRPGEALNCTHSYTMPGGCGTSEFCSSCGAAISIVSSLATHEPVERTCAITTEKLGRKTDLYFRVRCAPITYNSTQLLFLFLQDITYHQRLCSLERMFFHDINGIINGLLNGSYLIDLQSKEKNIKDLSQTVYRLSLRLASEIAAQRYLSQTDSLAYQPEFSSVSVAGIFQEITDIFTDHPATKGKRLNLAQAPDIKIKTEPSLIIRVLNNMITNAFEETKFGDEVKVWADVSQDRIVFSVWNNKAIPPDIAKRIFQRNFSTKAETGRGLGTFSMKLFGEDILGGKVDFTTSEKEGTTFQFGLQINS